MHEQEARGMKAVMSALGRICGPRGCYGKRTGLEEEEATSTKQTKHARALKSLLSSGKSSCYGAAWKGAMNAGRGEGEDPSGHSNIASSPSPPDPLFTKAAAGSAFSTTRPMSATRPKAGADASADLTFAPPSHRPEIERAQSCPAQRNPEIAGSKALRQSKTWSPSDESANSSVQSKKTPDSMRSAAGTPVQSQSHVPSDAAFPGAPPRAPRRQSRTATRGASLMEATRNLEAVQVVPPHRQLTPDAPRRNTISTKGSAPHYPLARAPPRRNTVIVSGVAPVVSAAPSTHRFPGDALSKREKQIRFSEVLGRIADGASRQEMTAAASLLKPLLAALQDEGLLRQPPSPVHSEPDSNPCSPSNRGLLRMRQHVRRTQRCSQTASECPIMRSAGYRPKGLEDYDDENQNPSHASLDREILSDFMG